MAGTWAGPVEEWAGLLLPAVVEVPLGSCRGRRVPQGRRRGWGEGCHGGRGLGSSSGIRASRGPAQDGEAPDSGRG